MRIGLCSYLLTAADYRRFNEESFWDVIQGCAVEVDFLPGCTVRMFEILLDYLGTECGISVRRSWSDFQMTDPPVAYLTRHEAQVLKSRLNRQLHDSGPDVFQCYGHDVEYSGEIEWGDFLKRQRDHLKSDGDVLLILGVENDTDLLTWQTKDSEQISTSKGLQP